jgi:histone H2A
MPARRSSKKSKTMTIHLPSAVPANAIVEFVQSKSIVTADGKRPPAKMELERPTDVFDTYIVRLLKSINADLSISKDAVAVMNAMMIDLGDRIAIEAASVARYNNNKTVLLKNALAGVGMVLRGKLGSKACEEATSAVAIYSRFGKGVSDSVSGRANLHFPVSRVKTLVKGHTNLRMGIPSAIVIAAALEYICAEILELAAGALTEADRSRIMPRFVKMAVESDKELSVLFAGANFITG